MTIYAYDVDAIPDANDHQLAVRCGGDIRGRVFGGFEHLLRMIACFQEGQVALALRLVFDPDPTRGRQNRLRLQLAVRIGEGISEAIVRQLVQQMD